MGLRLQVVSIFHEKKKTHPKSLIPDCCPAKLSELTARLFAWLGLATESKVPLIVDLEALRIRVAQKNMCFKFEKIPEMFRPKLILISFCVF